MKGAESILVSPNQSQHKSKPKAATARKPSKPKSRKRRVDEEEITVKQELNQEVSYLLNKDTHIKNKTKKPRKLKPNLFLKMLGVDLWW